MAQKKIDCELSAIPARFLFGIIYDNDKKDIVELFYNRLDDIYDLCGDKANLKNRLRILDQICKFYFAENAVELLLTELNKEDGEEFTFWDWKVRAQSFLNVFISDDICLGEYLAIEKMANEKIEKMSE